MACPVCGRVLCDHSPAERGQTQEEMMANLYAGTPSQRDTDSIPKEKKPPAHEVILEMLRKRKTSWERGVMHRSNIARARYDANALLNVLRCMHIPEHDRPRVIEDLRQLPRTMCGALDFTIDEIARSE